LTFADPPVGNIADVLTSSFADPVIRAAAEEATEAKAMNEEFHLRRLGNNS
jgi:hypothetical protein